MTNEQIDIINMLVNGIRLMCNLRQDSTGCKYCPFCMMGTCVFLIPPDNIEWEDIKHENTSNN